MLAGRCALVTGSSSGIGKATAALLAANGAKVAVTGAVLCSAVSAFSSSSDRPEKMCSEIAGRNTEILETVVSQISDKGGQARAFPGDCTIDAEVSKIVAGAAEWAGGSLDILVNSAGVLKGGTADTATMENWDFNMNVNARAVFCFMHNAIPFLKKAPEGKAAIVNVSSVNAQQSFGGVASYCASKAAVDMLTKCAAVDLAKDKIRVNAVNPGVVVTELQKRGGLDAAAYAAFLERSTTITHPLGRVAEPEEIAEAILFLCTAEKSGFITGACIPIDGGRACLGAR